eukprot:270586-Rhodomonas_salina.2
MCRYQVSVKCRIGAHEHIEEDGFIPEDDYETIANFVSTVSSTGNILLSRAIGVLLLTDLHPRQELRTTL